jgi:hypothetical protein
MSVPLTDIGAFLYGRHAKRSIPSGVRDPGDHKPRHAVDYSYQGHGDHFQEHFYPEKYCRHPHCKDTNWGGYGRLHHRSATECPPYERHPEDNIMADLWEAMRMVARENAERNHR